MTSHHKTLEDLEAKGLIVRDGDKVIVTPAGDEWTRELIAAYPNINKRKPRKCSSVI